MAAILSGWPRRRLVSAPPDTYWLTRFILLRWLGFIYAFAFFVAIRQLVPLVGANGLTPAPLFLESVSHALGSSWDGFLELPGLFWFDSSDTALTIVPWIGFILACVVLAGYANALILAVLWILYLSIVHIGQDWYGFGWEIQLLETGFLAIFLCPLLDPRPFSPRPPPFQIIVLFRWLIVRIMLGSALIKLRGDPCWHDCTALNYFFETQPIPNPLSRTYHFLPPLFLQAGTIFTVIAELVAPLGAFGPRYLRYLAGLIMIGFQFVIISSGNFSFFNWLTILPALACLDDRAWCLILPARLSRHSETMARPSLGMNITAWVFVVIVGLLSIQPVLNLLSAHQAMNTSFDRLHLVNTYGAFGTVGRLRDVVIFEGTDSSNPDTATDWKLYPYFALPCDPARAPIQVAPYQPHFDWEMWFAAMASWQNYPWTLNLVWKLLHNDPATLGLFASNPFPGHPPRYIRAMHYVYRFAPPGNPQHLYWLRSTGEEWLPPLSVDNPALLDFLRENKLVAKP